MDGNGGARVQTGVGRRQGPPERFEELEALIGARYAQMSRRLRDIAEFVLGQPNTVALETVAVAAGQAGVPPSALVRFAQALGFDGYSDMQKLFRVRLTESAESSAERLRAVHPSGSAHDLLGEVGEETMRALQDMASRTDPATVEEAARLLHEARSVHVIGQRRAFAVAAHLHYALMSLGRPVDLLDGIAGMNGQRIDLVAPGGLLIAVSYKPYAIETIEAVKRARSRSLDVLAVTDSPLSPLAPLASCLLQVRDPEVRQVRSLAASMSLAMLLVLATGRRMVSAGNG
ncbi:MAG: MurR/RpiR family transcriptional regulator [Geminicoccaceae bacterium]|nr:MurR/RpiR family transcriptional regulator [Geminicoccaceae bacterium]